MRSKIVIVILFSLFHFFSKGNLNVDSLLQVTKTSKNDRAVSNAYLQLAAVFSLNNPKLALTYLDKSILIFRKFSNDFLYERYLKKGEIFRLLGEIDSSLIYINLVYKKALQNNKFYSLSECYSEYGLIYIAQGNSQKAIEQFNKQLYLKKKHKFTNSYSGIYNNIGICYANKGDWDMAKEYFSKALNDDQFNLRDMFLGNDYNNLGVVFLVQYGNDSTKSHKNLDSARKYLNKGLFHRYKIHDSLGIAGSLNNLSLIENEVSNFKLALSLADSAFKIASLNGYKKIQVEVYDSYDQIYSKMGNYKMAYEYLNKKNKLNIAFEKEQLNNSIQQLESNIQLEQKQKQLLEKDLKLTKSENQKQKQLGFIVLAVILIIALFIFLFYFFKNNKALSVRNSIISEQKNLIEEKHKDISDSINYAQKIQSALIISEEKLKHNVKDAFVIFKPRDVVSGDFYWFTEFNDRKIVALSDCTGHGVPGAFMSMIGITLLNQIVKEKGITSPAQILNLLRKEIIAALSIDGSDKRDGMDMAIISFNDKELIYAGANSGALLLNESEITELKPNKQPIGAYEKYTDFTEEKINITPNLKVYLFSDGVVDQFGGPGGKKIKIKLFKEWLIATSSLPLIKQKSNIEQKLNSWKEGYEQTDDISLIGITLG